MYTTELVEAKIDLKSYYKEYNDKVKFIEFCKACPNYEKVWACPPFNDDIYAQFTKYTTAHIYGLKILIDSDTIENCTTKEKCHEVTKEIFLSVRKDVDAKLLEIEKSRPHSTALFPGSCRVCPSGECKRPKGLPCDKPELMRHSLESIGFDISKTTQDLLGIELKWAGENRLPEYYTLVYAIFE